LSLIPNSSRIFANVAARLRPECEHATSTISRSIEIGTPSFSKWTETATYALLLEDVQALVAKFNAPLWSYGSLQVSKPKLYPSTIMYLQHLSHTLPYTEEHLLDITGNGLRGRYVVFRPSCLHQLLKTTVLDNFEGSFAFGYPTDDLSPIKLIQKGPN
jgi:hypothetical protein